MSEMHFKIGKWEKVVFEGMHCTQGTANLDHCLGVGPIWQPCARFEFSHLPNRPSRESQYFGIRSERGIFRKLPSTQQLVVLGPEVDMNKLSLGPPCSSLNHHSGDSPLVMSGLLFCFCFFVFFFFKKINLYLGLAYQIIYNLTSYYVFFWFLCNLSF